MAYRPATYPPTPITNTRTITLHQSVDDQVTFHALRGPLRAITRDGQLPSKTETMRAAMEVCVMLERHRPGILIELLKGRKTLIPCREEPGPPDSFTMPVGAAKELLEWNHPLVLEADPATAALHQALERATAEVLKNLR